MVAHCELAIATGFAIPMPCGGVEHECAKTVILATQQVAGAKEVKVDVACIWWARNGGVRPLVTAAPVAGTRNCRGPRRRTGLQEQSFTGIRFNEAFGREVHAAMHWSVG